MGGGGGGSCLEGYVTSNLSRGDSISDPCYRSLWRGGFGVGGAPGDFDDQPAVRKAAQRPTPLLKDASVCNVWPIPLQCFWKEQLSL